MNLTPADQRTPGSCSQPLKSAQNQKVEFQRKKNFYTCTINLLIVFYFCYLELNKVQAFKISSMVFAIFSRNAWDKGCYDKKCGDAWNNGRLFLQFVKCKDAKLKSHCTGIQFFVK